MHACTGREHQRSLNVLLVLDLLVHVAAAAASAGGALPLLHQHQYHSTSKCLTVMLSQQLQVCIAG